MPRRPEVVPQVCVEPLVLAQHDAREHTRRSPAGAVSRSWTPSEPVSEAADTSAASHDPESIGVQNDVDSLTGEVANLVEIAFLLGFPGRANGGDHPRSASCGGAGSGGGRGAPARRARAGRSAAPERALARRTRCAGQGP